MDTKDITLTEEELDLLEEWLRESRHQMIAFLKTKEGREAKRILERILKSNWERILWK